VSEQNLDRVREGIKAMERGDLDAIVATADPNVEFVNPDDALEPGSRTGPEGLRAGLKGMLDAFEGLRIDVDRLVDIDEQVVVIGRFSGRGRGSGAGFTPQPFGLVLTMRGGKLTRYEWMQPSQALEAAGLEK
jgi:ketosteroid isomerase-like protein